MIDMGLGTEGRIAELEHRLQDLEEWLTTVADDMLERTAQQTFPGYAPGREGER